MAEIWLEIVIKRQFVSLLFLWHPLDGLTIYGQNFDDSGHCVQAASTASSVVLCPLYLQLVCWRSVRKKAPKIVWSQYLASGEKRLTCCCLTSFFLFIFATVAYDLRNDKLSQRVNCDLTKIQEIVIWNWCWLLKQRIFWQLMWKL